MSEIILPKIVAAGIYDSHHAVKNRSITKNRKTTMFEIEFPIIKGGVSFIDQESREISPSFLICAKPNQIRHTKLPYQCYYIHMIVQDETLSQLLKQIPNYFNYEETDDYRSLFLEILKFYDTKANCDRIMLQSKVLELIYRMYQKNHSNNNYTSGNTKNLIEKSLRYIDENLSQTLSLETVSNYVSISRIHFHNMFKTATGKTLHEYIEEQRIRKAVNLLLTTDNTLTEIAFQCGFSSQSYFSFVFNRRMGMTPRTYVKEHYKRYRL